MLTYETIRKIVTDEKNATKILPLPEGFFTNAKEYIDKKSKIVGSKEDAWELDSAKMLMKDLLEIRERKILNLALYYVRSGIMPGDLLPEEKLFFDNIVENIKKFQFERTKALESEPEKMNTVALIEDVPVFVGLDMKNYGPFKKGDVVNIPEENAKLLLEKGLAKRIET